MQTEPFEEGVRKLELTFTEKLVGGIVSFVIVGLLGWIATTSNDTAIRVAVLESTVSSLSQEVKESNSDRYSSGQANADSKAVLSRIEDHENRLRSVEERQMINFGRP